ncbi:uncharacterized protein BXZ73DRAFT_102842 [Epithele typhae]|uniref:uncharacterized protein n=1 Tax=Epithele typhae TaxID=378194 RepID=UPI0020076EC2|nr:uncharacterized protein BXZ73DRAFT_102842 [Epithele typhae]KAH9926582.1 hypothetical protein BXZ73DRAFT_102842 [Epithele typhae]
MQSYLGTALVGGSQGTLNDGLLFLNGAGNLVLNDSGKNTLNASNPVKKIDLAHGWVVDGITVTYRLANGGTSVVTNGTVLSTPVSSVTLGDTEVLVGVFGRAGMHSYYNRELVTSIGFVIFDTAKITTRTAGPFGNGDGSNQGKAFYTPDVLAFGSFTTTNGTSAAMGLSGLMVYRKPVC